MRLPRGLRTHTPRLAHYPHRTIHEAEPNLVPQAPPLLQTQYSVVKGLSKQSVLAPLSKSFNCNFSTRCHLIVADVYKLLEPDLSQYHKNSICPHNSFFPFSSAPNPQFIRSVIPHSFLFSLQHYAILKNQNTFM